MDKTDLVLRIQTYSFKHNKNEIHNFFMQFHPKGKTFEPKSFK